LVNEWLIHINEVNNESEVSMQFSLLQARNPNDIAKSEELHSFALRLGVDKNCIKTIDIFSKELSLDLLEDTSALLVGGAGEYSVLDDNPEVKRFINFLGEVCNTKIPVFASCFGFQAIVLALGGTIIKDVDNAEVGTYLLSKTTEATNDIVFSNLPKRFYAQLGHQDRAEVLPDCVTHLARSERAEYQAFKVTGKEIYATQFHPELTFKDNMKRFKRYMSIYGELFGEKMAKERMESHRPSEEANRLLNQFKMSIITK
jgi:GMP synthase (glutamine-hydrolysing)